MEIKVKKGAYSYMQNRELSWLRFNERVLQEAVDPDVPLFERLRFVSIFTSNLDEFFMIRVGSLFDLLGQKEEVVDNKTGFTVADQLKKIYEAVKPLYRQKDAAYTEIRKQMKELGIRHLEANELTGEEQKYLKDYFRRYIMPILSPQIVDNHHPFPFIPNKKPYIALHLENSSKDHLGLIPVPDTVPELIFLPGDKIRFIPSVKVIQAYSDLVFDMYPIRDRAGFYVTRNADISFEDADIDMIGDFRSTMKKLLKKRNRLEVVRMELEQKAGEWLKRTLCDKLKVRQEQVFVSRTPVSVNFDAHIAPHLDEKTRSPLYYKSFLPAPSAEVFPNESVIAQAGKKDILLSHPYESMEPFLRLIREASVDSSVISIKITIYRLAQKAKLIEYLCNAAENGKEVVALIELRARFDEQNNIDWSERLEEAGCRLIYGFGEYKVHSKVCLITRRAYGDYMYITQVGTGNYNEKTTELYTDFSLVTSNQDIGRDAANFFKNMTVSNLEGRYHHLLVGPNSMKNRILELIEEELEKGAEGRIAFKLNSITDIDVINKLRDASCAGVKIDLLVRGICCILPGIPGETENIRITSIVGRFLEHSRIFRFGSGKEQKLFISSADLMTRNMQRRVEVACPIYSEEVKERINEMFDAMFYDTEKARIMQSDGTYRKKTDKQIKINVQELFIEKARIRTAARPDTGSKLRERLLPVAISPVRRLEKYIKRIRGSKSIPEKAN
ncbi:MAG TPA: polyphosphate kinase 1 [Anaerovoracaceae bacterium]|nr:polyphosphate kinase 1 [Anaerovoracaceae bacterium]